MLNVIMLNVIMLNIIMLKVIMLNVVKLSVVAPNIFWQCLVTTINVIIRLLLFNSQIIT